MLEHNHSHVVKSGQGLQGTEPIDGARSGYQKQQPNIAMFQSQKLSDNSVRRNMHDPQTLNPQKIDNINEVNSSGFQKNGHKSKNKFRMYGSKRCLPAYTVLLRGQDFAQKSKFQNISPNTGSLLQNDYKSNPKSQGLSSISNQANHRKIFGAKKTISPSLTIIEPDSRMVPKDSQKDENKENSAFRNQPSLTIVPKQSHNDKRKSSLPKARMIGTQKKIRARIDEIGYDLEPIERNEKSRIQQNNQTNRQNETRQDSKRNKDNESDELNVNKLEEAQKKFLYEQENNENKTRNQKKKENKVDKEKTQNQKQNDDSIGETNRSLIKQTNSQEQKKEIPRHITNLTAFNKLPSVVLTPSKKAKAYIQYVEPQSKELRGFRRGHFLEEQAKQTNQVPKSNNKNSSQDPTFILADKSNTKDNVQPSMLGVNCNEANGKKEQSSLQLKIQSKIEGNNSNIDATDDKQNEKSPLLKKQEQQTKQKQEEQKNKRKPTIVLNSSKSINAYFQFLEEKQSNKKTNKAQNENSRTVNELTKAQATRSQSKKKMTMIGSHKSIQPYFENIEQQPARNRDQNVAGNSQSDRIIEDEVQEGFDHIQQDLLQNRIENNEKAGKQRKNSVKQFSSDKNVKAYIDYIEEPKNETVPKGTKDTKKGSTATYQKDEFKLNPSNYEPIKWFASYNSKHNQQPFELADKQVDHKKTSISMSSRKQLRSQIDLILQGELSDSQKNKKKNRSSKISNPNSSRRQLSSLKNINAYKQLIEEPNKSEENKQAVSNNKNDQQKSSIKQPQTPNNINITKQKQEKKVQVLDTKEAADFKPESYAIMDWYTTYNKKNTSFPYQLNNREVQKKKGISSRKDIRSQIDLILEEQVKKDDVKHISNSNSKISQNASSMKQLSSLKNVKAYVEYIEKPKQNSQTPVEITVKQQQSKKSSPAENNCDKKKQQLPTDNKTNIVPMKFNPQLYPQMNWYACYNKNNQSAPFEINDKLIEEKKETNQKQKVENISKQKVSFKKPINEAKNTQQKNKDSQEKPKEVKQAAESLGTKQNQNLPVVKQYSFIPSTYPIVDWYTGYDCQQPQSCFILSDKQQNTKLNGPEQKVNNCEDDAKKGEQKPYGKYLSYSQMSDSVVRMDSKLNEDQLKDKNGNNLLKEDTNKLTQPQNNENVAKKQSNQTDLNDLPADLSGTKGQDNFILPQKDQHQKSMPVKDENKSDNCKNNSQVSKQKSQSKSSKLSLSRGSEKNQETKSNGTQKLITQQVQINTKALIEDAYNKLQVEEGSKQQKPNIKQQKKEQKNGQQSKKVEKSDKATITAKKPDEKIKKKQDLKTVQRKENEEKKTNMQKQGQQMAKKEGDKKQAKKQTNSKQVQNDLENIKKQQIQSKGKQQNKIKPNENKSLSKRGSQIQLIPINAEHDKIDRFQEQEQEQGSKGQNNQNASDNEKNQNQFNNNSLSNRSLLSKSQDKGSLKALVRVSPKLERSQRRSNDSIRVDQEEDYEQQVKLEKISPKKKSKQSSNKPRISRQSQNKPRMSRRPSNQKISNEGQNNQIKKVGLYKFKQTIQSKQNLGSKPKRASNAKNEDLQNRIGKRSEESERYCPKTPINQSNSGQKYSSQNNRNKLNKNKKGKAASPYLQPAFMALRSEKSPKNDKYQNEEKRQAHSNNIIEEDSQLEASGRLRKQGIARRNKNNNIAYNERQIQKLKAEYQKIKKIEQSSQQRRQKTHKIRSIENERQILRSMQSEQQIRSHKFLRAHSHQFSYLYPTAQNTTENDKLAKKAKQLNQKLKRCSYTLGKRRQIDEVHEFISEARKQVRQSQKYLEQLE